MKMFKWQHTNKHVLSIHLKQNDSREQATFLIFGGNFLIFEQLYSNIFWVYCEATFPEFTSTIYSCLVNGVWGMENGEWRMGNGDGEWGRGMKNGEWGTGNGESLKGAISKRGNL